MRSISLSFILLFFLANSCSNNGPSPASPKQAEYAQLPDDFRAFYDKFHADSAYQMAHISWPLRGETSVQTDSTHATRRLASWEPEQWTLQHAVDLSSGEFKRDWEMLGKEFIIERIGYAAANYHLERQFIKREDGEWELIYYSDM